MAEEGGECSEHCEEAGVDNEGGGQGSAAFGIVVAQRQPAAEAHSLRPVGGEEEPDEVERPGEVHEHPQAGGNGDEARKDPPADQLVKFLHHVPPEWCPQEAVNRTRSPGARTSRCSTGRLPARLSRSSANAGVPAGTPKWALCARSRATGRISSMTSVIETPSASRTS